MQKEEYPEHVRKEIDQLRKLFDTLGPPAKLPTVNLILGSWNIRHFGSIYQGWEENPGSPKRNWRALATIAEVANRFDVLVIREVQQDTTGIRELADWLGPQWGLSISEVVGPGPTGSAEHMAFLYDGNRVRLSGVAGPLSMTSDPQTDLLDLFADLPYQVSFETAGEIFTLLVTHLRDSPLSVSRTEEFDYVVKEIRDRAGTDIHNPILLGDFRTDRWGDHPGLEAFISHGLYVPMQLREIPTTSGMKPLYYDQIGWLMDMGNVLEFDNQAGAIDFTGVVYTELNPGQMSWRVSDHLPLWVAFKIVGALPETAVSSEFAQYTEPGGPRRRFEQVLAGISFGSAAEPDSSETITALVEDQSSGELRLLLPGNARTSGAEIIQPGLSDGGATSDAIGVVVQASTSARAVASLARLEGERNFLSTLPDGRVLRGVREPELDMRVYKFGAGSGYKESRITVVDLSSRLLPQQGNEFILEGSFISSSFHGTMHIKN